MDPIFKMIFRDFFKMIIRLDFQANIIKNFHFHEIHRWLSNIEMSFPNKARIYPKIENRSFHKFLFYFFSQNVDGTWVAKDQWLSLTNR